MFSLTAQCLDELSPMGTSLRALTFLFPAIPMVVNLHYGDVKMSSQIDSATAANAEADQTVLRPVSPLSPSSSSYEAHEN